MGGSGLVEDHDIALLGGVAQRPDQKKFVVLQSIVHGISIHPSEAAEEGKDKHQDHQGGGQRVEPIKQVVGGFFDGFFLLRLLLGVQGLLIVFWIHRGCLLVLQW